VVADPSTLHLLKEYGLTDFESGTYTVTMGARCPQGHPLRRCQRAYGGSHLLQAAADAQDRSRPGPVLNERVLFYRGNILVDAVFEKSRAMSAASLRELSEALPLPPGTRATSHLPQYLPKSGYGKNTAKYVMGPVGLEKISAPALRALVDFGASAEVARALPDSGGTPRADAGSPIRRRNWRQSICAIDAPTQAWTGHSPELRSRLQGRFQWKRTGPIVAIDRRDLAGEARALSAVNYEADVTWNENTYQGKKNSLANLLLNVFLLCGILIVFAAVAGLAFGGIRIFFNRILPERVLHRETPSDFISLNLSEGQGEAGDSKVSPSIKAI
jgi:hypothetical protein